MSNARDLAVGGHRLVAWVSFDGTNANLSENSLAGVYQSHGVSGITHINSGNYIIHFSPELDDADYLVIANAYGYNESKSGGRLVSFYSTAASNYDDSKETTHVRVRSLSNFSGLGDSKNIFVLIFK